MQFYHILRCLSFESELKFFCIKFYRNRQKLGEIIKPKIFHFSLSFFIYFSCFSCFLLFLIFFIFLLQYSMCLRHMFLVFRRHFQLFPDFIIGFDIISEHFCLPHFRSQIKKQREKKNHFWDNRQEWGMVWFWIDFFAFFIKDLAVV